MTPSTDLMRATPALTMMPTAAAAMADVAITATQRTLALQVELIDGLVGLSIARSRRAFADPAGAMRDALLGPTSVEPAWRYATGLAAIGQQAAALLVSLATAQARGSSTELDDLSRDAKHAASRSAVDVASATNAAFNHGLAAIGRLAGDATDTALRSVTDGAMRAAADVAVRAGDAAIRGTGAAIETVDAATHAARAVPRVAGAAAAAATRAAQRADAERAAAAREGDEGDRAGGPGPRARAASKAPKSARPDRAGASRGGVRTGPDADRGRQRSAPAAKRGRGRGTSRRGG